MSSAPAGASPLDLTGDFRPQSPSFVESKKSLIYTVLGDYVCFGIGLFVCLFVRSSMD